MLSPALDPSQIELRPAILGASREDSSSLEKELFTTETSGFKYPLFWLLDEMDSSSSLQKYFLVPSAGVAVKAKGDLILRRFLGVASSLAGLEGLAASSSSILRLWANIRPRAVKVEKTATTEAMIVGIKGDVDSVTVGVGRSGFVMEVESEDPALLMDMEEKVSLDASSKDCLASANAAMVVLVKAAIEGRVAGFLSEA